MKTNRVIDFVFFHRSSIIFYYFQNLGKKKLKKCLTQKLIPSLPCGVSKTHSLFHLGSTRTFASEKERDRKEDGSLVAGKKTKQNSRLSTEI
jgi:hypothetical protein